MKWGEIALRMARQNPDVEVIEDAPAKRPPIQPGGNTVEVMAGNKRRNGKFNARKTTLDGRTFDSAAEARSYAKLQIMEASGEISDLELQPKFELQPAFKDSAGKTIRAITYTADFAFVRDGKRIIVDVKGGKATQTQAFRIKWKMLQYQLRDTPGIQLELWGDR